jgi:hypothetical protein
VYDRTIFGHGEVRLSISGEEGDVDLNFRPSTISSSPLVIPICSSLAHWTVPYGFGTPPSSEGATESSVLASTLRRSNSIARSPRQRRYEARLRRIPTITSECYLVLRYQGSCWGSSRSEVTNKEFYPSCVPSFPSSEHPLTATELQDIHSLLPLVVSSGADGKIRIWRIPPSLLGLSWPLHPHALRPPPSQTLKPPTLGPPIFSSRYIHDGVWPDQVVWASDASCHIVSKSSGTDEEGRPTKVIKMWSPEVLHRDLAPLDPKDDVKKREKERSTRQAWEADNDGIRQTTSILDDTTPLDYSVLWQIVLQDQNYVGDTFAIHRRPLFKKCDPESETTESFIAVAAMVDPPSILTYRISQHPDSPSYERTGKEDWGPPQLLPSSISPEVNKRHYRSVAVSPEGGKWMIAVGQEGSIAYWRRIKKK